jgi:vacuolar-type H+-ATPase subunit H
MIVPDGVKVTIPGMSREFVAGDELPDLLVKGRQKSIEDAGATYAKKKEDGEKAEKKSAAKRREIFNTREKRKIEEKQKILNDAKTAGKGSSVSSSEPEKKEADGNKGKASE